MAASRVAYIGLAAVITAGIGLYAANKVSRDAQPETPIDYHETSVITPDPPRHAPVPPAVLPRPDRLQELTQGLAALRFRQVETAQSVRDDLPVGSLDRHILSWAIALYGGNSVTSAEILRTQQELSDWPGANDLQRNLERALFLEAPAPETARKMLEGKQLLTPEGAVELARARLADGDRNGARNAIFSVWRSAKMNPNVEAAALSEFPDLLTQEDHRIRMERLLYDGDVTAATRVADRAQAMPLLTAWSAVLSNAPNARKLVDAVPGDIRSPGYSFLRIKLLRNANRLSEAAKIMLDAPSDANALIDPRAWWIERRLLARNLFDAGKSGLAYKLVSSHAAQTPTDRADAEFMAGWYALRGLNDPAAAERHFARIETMAEGAISRARAFYWMGRAVEAAGNSEDSKKHYAAAARYGTTFYGQLAAAKIGAKALNLVSPTPTEQDRTRFREREAVQAINRLNAAGQPQYAARLYLDLAQQIDNAGEIALLAELAEQSRNHFIALKVAKAAAQRGIDVGALSHPIGAIPDDANIVGAGKALAYAIARQESEFNVGAVSGAGALGLLQLMPATANETAQRTGLAYSQERLTVDPAYNASLGSAVLDQQLQRFGGSYILTFVAYNAGPRRADQWIARYGDPRAMPLDEVIDWIERIPFGETRAYVQRVMENYEVYKMRLVGQFDIVSDLTNGRVSPTAAD